jgi:hypothetical protein
LRVTAPLQHVKAINQLSIARWIRKVLRTKSGICFEPSRGIVPQQSKANATTFFCIYDFTYIKIATGWRNPRILWFLVERRLLDSVGVARRA